ncbi:MAG: putative zinc-binding protein [Candidatus Bathyarchaeota archaeon]|nr:putative zinc-binding protein [Candidatus Bathyarchaeota archaeon]MDH5701609.1 putative zinc-binding protein [Candidatus Bathyarchaeota archaeon]
MSEEEKVAIVACAGMDKPLGSVARACAFKVVEDLKPEDSVLVCIPPLVAGVKPHSEWIKKYPIITIDGCPERCATKIVAKNGGKIRGRVFIPQSVQKYGLKPKASEEIGPEGEELAEKIAEDTALLVDKILRK